MQGFPNKHLLPLASSNLTTEFFFSARRFCQEKLVSSFTTQIPPFRRLCFLVRVKTSLREEVCLLRPEDKRKTSIIGFLRLVVEFYVKETGDRPRGRSSRNRANEHCHSCRVLDTPLNSSDTFEMRNRVCPETTTILFCVCSLTKRRPSIT